MRTVYKYDLPAPGKMLGVPVGADFKPLCIMMQNGEPRLWAEVERDGATRVVDIYCIGTGWDVPDDADGLARYLGSVVAGAFVWHYYALT